MKKIPVADLLPGVAYDKPVYIDPNNIFVQPFEPIKQDDIDRLNKWNITYLESNGNPVFFEDEEEVEITASEQVEIDSILKSLKCTIKNVDSFRSIMGNGEFVLKKIYKNLSQNGPTETYEVRNLAEEIVNIYDIAPLCHFYLYDLLAKPNLYRHVLSAGLFATLIGNEMYFSKPKIIDLVFSILLMDVGMLRVPYSILEKEGKLTSIEKIQYHAHPVLGYQILTQVAKLKNQIAQVALQHNEQFDGKGYPMGITSDKMIDNSRIAAIVDSYIAILEKKKYRRERLPHEAIKELLTLGIHRYDPIYLRSFLDKMSFYPMGSLVETSDNCLGIIVGSNEGKPMRPTMIIIRKNNITPRKVEFLNLLYRTDLYIRDAKSYEDLGINFTSELAWISNSIG